MKKYFTLTLALAALFVSMKIASQTTINYSETLTGTISVDGEVDIFTFSGSSNDKVIIVLTENSGSLALEPNLVLYNSSGTIIKSDFDNGQASIFTTLPTDGNYSIFVSDKEGDDTGNYGLFLQRTFDPFNADTIQYGQTKTGKISTDGEIDTYVFQGTSGDSVLIVLTENSSALALEPYIRLYNPEGELINTKSNNAQASIFTKLTADGTYTIFASDSYDGDDTGDYGLFVQRTFNPLNADTLSYGQTKTASISTDGEIDSYLFQGSAGDRILLVMTENSGNLAMEPYIRLFDPLGGLIKEDSDNGQASIYFTLPSDGDYTVLASDSYDGDDTGNYGLYLQRTFDPFNADTIQYGQTKTGNISTDGEIDTYVFQGTSGDSVIITLTENSSTRALEPFVQLFHPSGEIATSGSDNTQATIGYRLTEGGYHTILARDAHPGDDAGSYSIFIFGFPAPNNNETDFLSFQFGTPPQTAETNIDYNTHNIDVEVEAGTDLTNLVASFTLSDGAIAKLGDVVQESGVTANDFTDPVTYSVTAQDGVTKQDWVVTVSIPVGTGEHYNQELTIYPNPFSDKTTIEFSNPDHSEFSLILYSITGNKVYERKVFNTDRIELDRGSLKHGVYIIEIRGDWISREMIIIE